MKRFFTSKSQNSRTNTKHFMILSTNLQYFNVIFATNFNPVQMMMYNSCCKCLLYLFVVDLTSYFWMMAPLRRQIEGRDLNVEVVRINNFENL